MKKFIGLIIFISVSLLADETHCAFCQQEVIERQLFYQGNHILGLVTYKPAMKGHILILPSRHVERFEEMTSLEIAEMGEAIKRIDAAVKRLYGTTGYALIQKNGRESGQSVPHVHVHYLPSKKSDRPVWTAIRFLLSPYFPPLSGEEMKPEIAALQRELSFDR